MTLENLQTMNLRPLQTPNFHSTENVVCVAPKQDAPTIQKKRPRPPAVIREKSTVHKEVFNVRMLAERWGCTESHIYSLIRKGQLRTFKIGEHSIRIRAQEVERFETRDLFCAEESGAPVSEACSDDLYIPRTEA